MTQSEQFDTELFILEIEERPALWNNTLKEYSEKNLRKAVGRNSADIWWRGIECGRQTEIW
jgi:hypothetical protein